MPFITTAAYTATGSVGYALIYPIAVPAICLVLGIFLMPETRKMRIWEPEAAGGKGIIAKLARPRRCGARTAPHFLSAE